LRTGGEFSDTSDNGMFNELMRLAGKTETQKLNCAGDAPNIGKTLQKSADC
jgi:hypothetical protein